MNDIALVLGRQGKYDAAERDEQAGARGKREGTGERPPLDPDQLEQPSASAAVSRQVRRAGGDKPAGAGEV